MRHLFIQKGLEYLYIEQKPGLGLQNYKILLFFLPVLDTFHPNGAYEK